MDVQNNKPAMKRFILVGFQVFFAAAGFLFLTVACTTVGGTRMTPTHTSIVPVTSQPDALDSTRWELVAFESEARIPGIPEQPRLFLEFNRGVLGLQGGCNAAGGYYRIENNRITIPFVEATLVDCSDSMPGMNELESALSDAMPTVESYTIQGDELRIRYTHGEILFRRVSK